jgi:predicted dehydrogenase
VVVVGCGDMGRTHAECWRQNPLTTVAGAADPLTDRLAEFSRKFEVPNGAGDFRSVIDEIRPDIVSVCVPACMHPEVACYAAEKGAHVMCEKPIALTVEEGQRMIDACRDNNVLLGISFQRRYWGNTSFYKRMVAEGAFGRPVFWKRRDIREVRPKTLMHEKRGNGGSIVDCGVHWFDQWRHILNADPVRVFARGGCFGRGKRRLEKVSDFAVDTGIVTVEYASGDVGEVTMCWGLPENTPAVDGELAFGPKAVAKRERKTITLCSGADKTEEEVTMGGHKSLINAFADAVVNGKPSPVSGEDGLVALKVALAALESIETGQPVDID